MSHSKHLLFFLFLSFCSSHCFSQIQCLELKNIGGTTSGAIQKSVKDANGNSYITGYFNDSMRIGGQIVSHPALNYYVAKIDSVNELVWYKIFTQHIYTININIALDNLGAVVVTGCFYDNVTFDSYSFMSLQFYDIFIAKLDAASGTCTWLKRAGDIGSDICQNLTLDVYGNIYITGAFHGYCQFGTITLVCTGTLSGFIAKYNPSGNIIWAKHIIEQSGMMSEDVAVDVDGNVLLAGGFSSSANFGNGIVLNTTGGNKDSFLAKYDSLGTILWAKQTTWFNTTTDKFKNVKCDAAKNIYVLHEGPSALLKYSPTGDTLWSIGKSVASSSSTFDFLLVHQNKIFLAGNYNTCINFGSDSLLSNSTGLKFYTAKFDTVATLEALYGFETNNSINLYASSFLFADSSLCILGNYLCTAGTLLDTVYNLPCSKPTNFFTSYACTSFLGLENNSSVENKIHIYPNPFSESCKIDFGNSKREQLFIQLYDIFGRRLDSFSTFESTYLLLKTNLKNGIYFLEISNSQNFHERVKLAVE